MIVALTTAGIVGLHLIDLSTSALRITYLVRDKRLTAGILGFFA